MKLCFLYVAGSKEPYAEAAEEVFRQKIKPLIPFEIHMVKAKTAGRDDAEFKRKIESEKLNEFLRDDDFIWLFDEGGRLAQNSIEYSRWLCQAIDSGKHRVVMIIGGPYGFTAELKKRAQKIISLSPLTMNHHIAKLTALEQTYRALTLQKNLPYHNS